MSNTNNLAAIAVSKSLLKEYVSSESPRTVYLNNGDEFQIKLFNPETVRISAMIYIDGQYLGNDIILRPGETLWLERYLDKARKFRFETYEVESGNSAVDRAIRENGKVEVRFYREKPRKTNPIQFVDLSRSALFDESDISTLIGQRLYSKGIVPSSAVENHVYTVNAAIPSSELSISTSACSDLSFSTSASTVAATLDWVREPATKETGRVSEGTYSNQHFREVNVDVESWSFRTEVIKIMPRSQKPYTKNDLNKIYCTSCGRKIKPKFKFCPFCGAKQD